MDEKKSLENSLRGGKESDFPDPSASRARNRTVMLTPEITGQVRARLAQEGEPAPEPPRAAPQGNFVPAGNFANQTNSGFVRPGAAAETVTMSPQAPMSRETRPLPPPARSASGVVWAKETPIIGFLVSYDSNPNGEVYELRSGRLMISSQGGESNTIVLRDDTVSPMHAIMRITATGEIQVLDQLSEHGTRIKRFGSEEEEQLSGDKTSLEHGDVIRFGNRSFNVCIVARSE